MHRGIGGIAFEPAETRRDREVTLGPTMLLLLGLGLFTLCGVCFVFGYAVGQHVSPPTAARVQPTATTGTPAQNTSTQLKPAASQNSFQPRPAADAQPAAGTSADPATQTPDAGQPAQSTPVSPQPNQNSAQASGQNSAAASSSALKPVSQVVKTVPLAQSSGQQAPVSAGSVVRPALPQVSAQPGTWMVQIAAVSHPGDAEVLVSALRRRGYAVAVYRDPVDTLMHVQVGPFATHSDAVATRQKLLNDGYNAIVQP
jgi:DedD protein